MTADRPMTHAPNCQKPGTTTEQGHSIIIVRCLGCGALTTTRKGTNDHAARL